MNNPFTVQANIKEVKSFLRSALLPILSKEKNEELIYMLDNLKSKQASAFFISFSKAVRTFGKNKINYTAQQFQQAGELRQNWIPPTSVDSAVRLLILLEISDENETVYLNTLENLFGAGDVAELIALYSSLPLLSFPEKLTKRCMEGVRTNMGEVFEAIANNNPYPADYLSEDAFNQMVLKCLFVGKPLFRVINLHHRLNKNLARMASDYAHERWAANRKVNPELWQLVAPFLEIENMKDIQKLDWSEDEMEKQAAALVCSQSQITIAEEIYKLSSYHQKVESTELNWTSLGQGFLLNS